MKWAKKIKKGDDFRVIPKKSSHDTVLEDDPVLGNFNAQVSEQSDTPESSTENSGDKEDKKEQNA